MDDHPLDDDTLLAEQLAYYRAGAAAYDRQYTRYEGLRKLLTLVDGLPVTGDVLEPACGSGRWTRLPAARARSVTAVDGAAEMPAIARRHVSHPGVRFLRADLFEWRPHRRYDTVFFAFWLSHVPPARLPAFWTTVAAAPAPGGRAIFVDDGPATAGHEELLTDRTVPTAVRRLDDGSRYRIAKTFRAPRTVAADLATLDWSARVRPVGGNIVGIAKPPSRAVEP